MTSIAETLITDARSHATETINNAINAMNFAITTLGNLQPGNPTAFPNLVLQPPTPGSPGALPAYAGSHFQVVPFNGTRPVLNLVPPLTLPPAPGSAPDLESFDDPGVPVGGQPDPALISGVPAVATLVTPDPLDLLSEIRSIPSPPLLQVTVDPPPPYYEPSFDAVRPNVTPPTITDLGAEMRTQYSTISPIMREAITVQFDAFLDREFPQFRSGMAAIESRLATYLAGGSALSTAVEDAIYSRTLDKTNTDAVRASRKAYGEAARAGFVIPAPALLAQLRAIDQDRRDANNRAAIDIAIEQAKLEQSNLQFAVTQSSNLRQIALTAAGAYYSGLVQINGQALEYARSVVDAIVKGYDIVAKYAELQARIYEAEARVYEVRLKGAMAKIEAYVAQLKGLEAQANINMAQVGAYKARLEAVQAEATIYKASIDAVLGQAQIERAKVELYQAKVQAYGAQVNALTARYQGYAAAVAGQVAKVQASAEQIKAYGVQVQVYGEVVKAKLGEIEGLTKSNEALTRMYQVDVEAYAALNRAQAEAVHAEVESFGTTVQAYIAGANAISAKSASEIAAYEAGLRSLQAQAQLMLEKLRQDNALEVARLTGIANVATASGQIWSAQAQASLSGMNTLAAEVVQATA